LIDNNNLETYKEITMEEIKKCMEQAQTGMESVISFFDKELQKVRAGKASPQMLEGLKVEYYGNLTPIEQVANINTPDARQIVVQPWERNMLPVIEKAILVANLGFTPQNNGEFIRIIVPTMTEERRKELVKKVKQDTEQNKVSIRNIRRTANETARKLKDSGTPEDEVKKLENDIQKLTDDFIAKIDKMSEAKEKEIMTV
jgi:ribosome recycling factor